MQSTSKVAENVELHAQNIKDGNQLEEAGQLFEILKGVHDVSLSF